MSLSDRLIKLFGRFLGTSSVFSVSPEKQKRYLDSQPEPHDNIERSFLQYKCQMFIVGASHYLLNLAAGIYYPFKYFTIHHKFPEKKEKTPAVFCTFDLFENILPDELFSEFGKIVKFDYSLNYSLNKNDRAFLREIAKRYPCRWHFRLKCLLKIAMYRYVLDSFQPKAIISSSEYSFVSSVMTEYLHRNGIEHINVMHGEKLFFIRDSFFSFDRYYIWNDSYKKLFESLRADVSCLKTAIPPVLRLPKTEEEPIYDFTFYLQNESAGEVEKLVSVCKLLSEKGYNISIRPHPTYTKISKEQLASSKIAVEKNSEISIEKSLRQTKCAVSLYSTVLLQAYSNGIAFVIDDITRPALYEQLKGLSYIGFSLEHRLLSDIMKTIEKTE